MDRQEIYETTTRHFLQPIVKLLEDPRVSEILVNGPGTVYCERDGRLSLEEGTRFASEAALLAAARNIAEYAGRPIGGIGPGARHSMDARLPDGSRVHVILPPSSRVGVCLSIRKFNSSTLDLARLVELDTLTAEAAEFLALCVGSHRNLIVSGGTGSGKTSLLNALSGEIPASERIVVLEDSSELQLRQPHTVYLESQPPDLHGQGAVTIRDLFVDSLRMRPDRIVVGEVRRGEALELVQSMISGHSGALATVHASTPRDALIRLETLSLMSGVEIPIHVARMQVASAVHVLVQINRMIDGRRRVVSISEACGLDDSDNYRLQEIFRFHVSDSEDSGQIQGYLQWTGVKPLVADQLCLAGIAHRIQKTREIFAENL